MKSLFKKLLPPIFFDFWHYTKVWAIKPKWHTIKSGPLKDLNIFVNDGNKYYARMRTGTYDSFIYKSIGEMNLAGKTVLDVGCHIGYHSFGFSQLVKKKGIVYAVDPNPYNLERLEMIVHKNSSLNNIKICNLGISDRIGESVFNFSRNVDDMTSSGGFIEGTLTPLADKVYLNAGFVKEKIDVTTLDQFVHENEIDHLSIIKIDVEGHEANVLRGGIDTLKNKSPIVLIEIHTIKAMYDSDNIMKRLGYHSDVINQDEDGRLFLKYYKD